jgi:hypothetical protein
MAVTAENVVRTRLRPVLEWSADFTADIDSVIEQQIVAEGWSQPLTEARELYVGLKTVRALILQLIAHAMNEARTAKSGEETVEWEERAKLLRLLAEEVSKELKDAGAAADPIEPEDELRTPPPLVGIRKI